MNVLATDMIRGPTTERIGNAKGAVMMEDPQTPGSDCNSNPAADPTLQDLIGSEFVQDNSEYQWFIDYSYRDGGLHVHPSVLSSLSASYTQDDLGYYNDLARNLDANLAEVDMESFRTADIHTLLTALPVMCTDPVQRSEFNYQRERYASISGSVMEKFDIGSSISPHTSSQGEDSACSTADTISICKSSLLFSPVKETPVLPPGGSYSVDSLDCEDMLLTCQTNNKNNYTIAFEGSITMYSDGSQDFDGQEKPKAYEAPETYYEKQLDLKNMLDLSMACSDSKIYTTWSNLKHSSINKAMSRHPSGNNNTIPNFLQGTENLTLRANKRSQSLPDLRKTQQALQQINVPLNFSVDSAESSNHATHLHSSGSVMSRSVNDSSSDSVGNTSKKLHNLSLVKLFMKQKSMSVEGMSLTLDQSDSASDGWPTGTSCSDSGTNTNTQIPNRLNINRQENDFSINWLKNDNCDNTPRQLPISKEHKEEIMTSSLSIEELTEELSKSEAVVNIESSSEKWAKKTSVTSKTTGTQATTEIKENSVQTSLIYPISTNKTQKVSDGLSLKETMMNKRPVYIVYPNYTLPDLSFLNTGEKRFENVALKPQGFNKENVTWKRVGKSGRPFSCNDIDALKQRGFAHVRDWESLTFLLPNEYRKILRDVPELSEHIKPGEEMKKPLFCLSPPMRQRRRTVSDIVPNNVSSSSSTATQPSSGYRGSSTILTDSSSTNQQTLSNNNTTNPLYLYRYDSVSSETSLVSQDKNSARSNSQIKVNGPTFPKRSVSLPHGDKDTSDQYAGKAPPRPPLPRSILRKNRTSAGKRCSMFEMGDVEEVDDQCVETNKRMSLQEPYYMNNDLHILRHGRIDDSDKDVDEIEEKSRTDKLKELANQMHKESETLESSEEDMKQLEEFLKRSGFSSHSSDGDEENSDIRLRSCVRKFLNLKMNKDISRTIDMVESQKKTVSFAVNQNQKYMNKTYLLDQTKDRLNTSETTENTLQTKSVDLEDKKKMLWSVNKAVDILLKYWHTEPVLSRQGYSEKNECAQLCVSTLCPALYAVMSDGLKPSLDSAFGPIANSVWQVVEASSQQGPLTKTLNDLVQKINGEDFMTEGMLKFHAFVFGLLNLRALDAWFAYLCTRESILRKHYNSNSLFVGALACVNTREVVDTFLETLQPLAFCPFQLDLLYQYRQLHNSFGNVTNHSANFRSIESPKKERTTDSCNMFSSPRKVRPRSSYISYAYEKHDAAYKTEANNVSKKRWSSNLPLGSRVFNVFEKRGSDDSEDYTDSLEHSPLNRGNSSKQSTASSKTLRSNESKSADDENTVSGDVKSRTLQEKWELMIGKDEVKEQGHPLSPSSPNRTPTSAGKSKIPRLLTSPIKQQNNTVRNTKSPVSGIPSLRKPIASQITKVPPKKAEPRGSKDTPRRTSRMDQDTVSSTRTHLTRPSSLPYKSYGITAKEKNAISPHRRAASTSLPRPTSAISATAKNITTKQTPKFVRTLSHRLPSQDGHLSFNEGEKLKVILEVDNKWLLCARGERKGLVPRTCVNAIQT